MINLLQLVTLRACLQGCPAHKQIVDVINHISDVDFPVTVDVGTVAVGRSGSTDEQMVD